MWAAEQSQMNVSQDCCSPPPVKISHFLSLLFFTSPPVISCNRRVITTDIPLQVCLVLQLFQFMLQDISSFNTPFYMFFCSTQLWERKHSFYLWLVKDSKKRNQSKNKLYLQVRIPLRSAWTMCIRISTSSGLGNVSGLGLSGHLCDCGHLVPFLYRLSYKSGSEASSVPL